VEVATLGKQRKELFVPFGDADDGVNLVYNPKAYTLDVEDRLNQLAERTLQSEAMAITLETMVVEWDITDEGKPVPVTVEGMKQARLPVVVMGELLQAIRKDTNPTTDEGKGSGGGQDRAA
jgi:hypothetical protein